MANGTKKEEEKDVITVEEDDLVTEDKLDKSEDLFKQYEQGVQGRVASLEDAAAARLAAAPAGVAAAMGQTVNTGTGTVGGGALRQAAGAAGSAMRTADIEAAQLQAEANQARADAAIGIQEAGIVAGAASEAQIKDEKTSIDNAINSAIKNHKGTFNDDEDSMYNEIVSHLSSEYASDFGGDIRDFEDYTKLNVGDPDPNNPGKTVTSYQKAMAEEVRLAFKQANDIKYGRIDV
jgi:hypothetical protein